MTRKAIRDRIHEILNTVVGVKTIPPRIPQALQLFELPVAFARDTGGQVADVLDGGQGYRIRGAWQISLFVAEVNVGLRAEHEDTAYDLADKVYRAFIGRPNLMSPVTHTGLTGVVQARVISDSGLRAPIAYPDAQGVREFYGYQFQLEVTYDEHC